MHKLSLPGFKIPFYIDGYQIANFNPFTAYFGSTGATGYDYNLQEVDNFNLL